MEFILIFLLLVVTLGAVLTWIRRGQSSIGRESGDTIARHDTRHDLSSMWAGRGRRRCVGC
jgi:hypothetical protein